MSDNDLSDEPIVISYKGSTHGQISAKLIPLSEAFNFKFKADSILEQITITGYDAGERDYIRGLAENELRC